MRNRLIALFAMSCALHGAQAGDAGTPCRRLLRAVQCATVPLAGADEDAEAKRFQPPPDGRARVYVLRPGTMAPAVKSTILLDGRPMRELAPQTYAVIDTSAGTHRIAARTDRDAEIELDLEPGRIRYVENRFSLLFFTVSGQLRPLEAQPAQAAIAQSRLVKSGAEGE
ncbi:DUF2846 domain-containing protein [Ralstonia sp. RL]|uniref:DUF2846 domain-containing protein n=1 Tax=Ralstonia sp. RL TaxID=1839756 RepID=UPI002580DCDA|nr:DUF2846 domain-containing protein [Ralstonia sp. RL]